MSQAVHLDVPTLTKPIVISNLIEEIHSALKMAQKG